MQPRHQVRSFEPWVPRRLGRNVRRTLHQAQERFLDRIFGLSVAEQRPSVTQQRRLEAHHQLLEGSCVAGAERPQELAVVGFLHGVVET